MSVDSRVSMPFGATVLPGGGVRFRLYAPSATHVAIHLEMPGTSETLQRTLVRTESGFHEIDLIEAGPGTRYSFSIDGLHAPDPAARYAPDGVHGPSVVVDPAAYEWRSDSWRGRPWPETIFYELHVGTFTPRGTFAAVAERLADLAALGITALQIMPLAEAPGTRNWGYDGVLLFAPSHNYGTPDDLRALVDRAHELGIAVYLDVVYNHFGPEGNYLHAYAPEFYTERHRTPWGAAIDVEHRERTHVRAFFIANAQYWLREFHLDGLRLDAVHAIYDGDDRAFLRELAAAVHAGADRRVYLVVENEDNESALLDAGFRAQWNDDAHHAAHVLATGQRDGYYSDYATDPLWQFGRTLTAGFAYQGEPSAYRKGVPRGEPSGHLPLVAFVNFVQNHDQIGNRAFGERIASLAPAPAVRAIVAATLLAPSIPMLFMGEEWAATTPFQYFCDFEPALARAVAEGRRAEFASFAGFANEDERERIPDPTDAATFARSTLRWEERTMPTHAAWLAFYRELLHVRMREIVPRIAGVTGCESHYETFGDASLRATWRLDDGTILRLDGNFDATPAAEFSSTPNGTVLYSTHAPHYAGGVAPPWSVRWTLA